MVQREQMVQMELKVATEPNEERREQTEMARRLELVVRSFLCPYPCLLLDIQTEKTSVQTSEFLVDLLEPMAQLAQE